MLTARPSSWSGLVPVIALLAGLLLAASGQAARGTDLRSDPAGLADVIRERQRANAERAAVIASAQQRVDELTAQAAPGSVQLRLFTAQGDALAAAAGTQAVSGPTLQVALDDSPLTTDQLPEWAGVDDIVVHQQDVQAVVNALWRGGAEAMMIMDQRVVATSAVRCVGNTLILQGRVYSPPFVISAIGPVDALEGALAADETIQRYQEYVVALGLGYAVERTGERTFPAFVGQLAIDSADVAD